MITLNNICDSTDIGVHSYVQSNADNASIIEECMIHLSDLEKSDPRKFDEIMTKLENEAKERGIDIDNPKATMNTPASTGILLPNSNSELSIDGKGSQVADKGCLVTPLEGFVVKTNTTASQTQKVFINVCCSDMIDEPGESTKLDDEGKEVTGINMPISVGPSRTCLDKAGEKSIAVDCIVNPTILDKINADKSGSYRDFVCQMVIQYVEMKHRKLGQLERKYKLPKMKYHAYVDKISGLVVPKNDEHAGVAQQRIRARKSPKIEIVERPRHDGADDDSSQLRDVSIGAKTPNKHKYNILKQLPCLRLNILVEFDNSEIIPIYQQYPNENYNPVNALDGKLLKSNSEPASAENSSDNSPLASHKLPQLLLSNAFDRAGREVKKVHIASKIDKNLIVSAKVDISAWMCLIRVRGFAPAECIVPHCIEPKSARCVYNPILSTLTVSAATSMNKINIDPDIGSPQWALSQGIKGSCNSTKEVTSTHDSNTEYSYTDFSSTSRATKNSNGKIAASNLDELPEDRFHSNDLLSKCILDQQRKERQDKIDASEERKKTSSKVDHDVEYINAEDFIPGGKYDDSANNKLSVDGRASSMPLARVHQKLSGLPLSSSLWTELV
uniref:PIH1 N-terminal domain-containing protein n=2 Tax=Leptocylindrus danicus TaxID=163516 RepID=A0A7S2P774_9STRA|mmetsp:Transcript_24455/g.36633  ORF Transcript_24455/g.36633 Transcript_24455/m.36633 type:complete len:615 (+) Transcript_24455:164-2008(+)|eukprot:CAMPEP_0116014192 /NCGR_PEP_ID=MMETSP0321-20121206/6144_1 /TAXON_ID=163516 /ORGANISM="Leptocylindrus danicus var. danicus, Strain B650" /LENGTH=614 /DNA_ID=CAMNT_0003483823 /DNA_START=3481 /DNA_END=5325 /DNA_ORIENTATION=+